MQTLISNPTINVNKLSKHVGVEVSGIDLTRPVPEPTRRHLHDLVVENIALVIRGQSFTPEQFLAAARLFGEPMERESNEYALGHVPFVHEVSSRHRSKDGSVKRVGPGWHTDHPHQVRPPKFTILYAVELPAKGGGTSIANMHAGYDALPDDLKHRIEGLKTANVLVGSAVKNYDNQDAAARQEALRPDPIIQPLVRTHPESGRKALYFSPNKTERILGMSPDDSQALLYDLLDRAIRPEFVYSHTWKPGDMLLWDNRSAMHKANYDYDPADTTQHRLLYRILIQGDVPY